MVQIENIDEVAAVVVAAVVPGDDKAPQTGSGDCTTKFGDKVDTSLFCSLHIKLNFKYQRTIKYNKFSSKNIGIIFICSGCLIINGKFI